MINEKYYEVTNLADAANTDFWTNKLYNIAYDKVKNHKFPLVIPSYNRPNNKITQYISEHIIDSEPWDIYVAVRESQKDLYENDEYFKKCKCIKTLAFPDDEINDAGKVRGKIVEHFIGKANGLFMMDDDVFDLTYTTPFKRSSGNKISAAMTDKARKENFSRTLAMWQVAMEETIKLHDNVIITCPMIAGFSWPEKYCDPSLGIKIISGAQVCCLGINLNACDKYKINFRTSIGNGHEDKDFVIRAILKGCITAEYRWLAYSCPSMGKDFLNTGVKERMAKQHDEMYANFKDVPFVKWIVDRNDYKNVRINWNAATKFYNDLTGSHITKDNNKYDLSNLLNL